jgi:large subunit ribosomal protein L4
MALKQELTYKVQNLEGKTQSDISIALAVSVKNPKYLVHRAVVAQDSSKRQGNASTKTRSEVRGGGRKPWKQKGTGNARAGSSNSPLWCGGGVSFGPTPRLYSKKINIKERRLALNTVLKTSFEKTVVTEDFIAAVTKPNTKAVISILKNIVDLKDNSKKVLVIIEKGNKNLNLSLRNLKNTNLLYSNTLNIKDLLVADKIVITTDALKNIQETYSG